MKITREKLIQVWTILSQLSQVKTTAKGAYGIGRNKRAIESEIKSLEEAQKAVIYPDSLNEFHSKRVELCREFADKDADGNPKMTGQSFVMTTGRSLFEEKLIPLREEYKEPLEAANKIDSEFHAFLQEEIEVEVFKIKIDDVPNDISGAELEILGEIIAE
jgi:hypothetical protein